MTAKMCSGLCFRQLMILINNNTRTLRVNEVHRRFFTMDSLTSAPSNAMKGSIGCAQSREVGIAKRVSSPAPIHDCKCRRMFITITVPKRKSLNKDQTLKRSHRLHFYNQLVGQLIKKDLWRVLWNFFVFQFFLFFWKNFFVNFSN